MNNIALVTLLSLPFLVTTITAQDLDSLPVIDIELLREQSYLQVLGRVDCDSTSGTVLEERICANLELQRLDSVLQELVVRVSANLQSEGLTRRLESFLLGQRLWERYRFAQSDAVISDDRSRLAMIDFMKEAARMTVERIREVELML